MRVSGSEQYTLEDLAAEYPDDDACLEHMWRERFSADGATATCPKCHAVRRFHRAVSRPSWCCGTCGHHVHPAAGTIFHRSSTPLRQWFQAIYLMARSDCSITAKELERELGVTYKTALRMFHLIQRALTPSDDFGVVTPSS